MTIKRLQKVLTEKKADFALFLSLELDSFNPNLRYFSGYHDTALLIVPKNGKTVAFLPEMDLPRFKTKAIKAYAFKKRKRMLENVSEIIKRRGIKAKKIGVDYGNLTMGVAKALKKRFRRAKLVDISEECERLRAVKTKNEIEKLKKACKISDMVMQKTISLIRQKKLMNERDIADFLHLETIRNGCKMSFPPIVASGGGASVPHHEPSARKLKRGFLVIDYGAEHQGYKADITRTLFFGKASDKERRLYEHVLKCQKQLIKEATKGKRCSQLMERANALLGDYAKYFVHGLGHGIGLKIHESPSIHPKSEDIISEGSVFTIEPGVYIKNKIGIRIEDDVAIIKGKTVVLTKMNKKFVEIK